MAPIGRVMRALAALPMSDRVSRACVGWAFSTPAWHWVWAFPLLAAGVAVCAAAQGVAFILSLALLAAAALILGIGDFGFNSDKKVALRHVHEKLGGNPQRASCLHPAPPRPVCDTSRPASILATTHKLAHFHTPI